MPDLDPTLATWRQEQLAWLSTLGDPLTPAFDEALLSRAKSMDSPSRIQVFERYRALRAAGDGGQPRSIAENKWVITLLSADRADAVRASRSDKSAAKKASADDGKPALTLASLLGGMVK